MKVFVVGTASWFCNDADSQKQKLFSEFKVACKNIGAWLSNKHHVIIAGTIEPYADHWVIEGVKENFEKTGRNDKANITLYAAHDDESHRQSDNPLLGWLKSYGHVSPLSTNYLEAHQKALEECDIVLVIGGKVRDPDASFAEPQQSPEADNVAGVCVLAKRTHKKPLVGLFHYGSHGRNINLKTAWLYELSGGIPEDNLDILNGPLDRSGDEKLFLELLELIFEKNPLKKRRWALFCIVLALILLFLWSLAFWGLPWELPRILEDIAPYNVIRWTTLIASIIAGALGGILRLLINKVLRIKPEEYLGADICLGLIAGCAISLFILCSWSWLIGDQIKLITDQKINIHYDDLIKHIAFFSSLMSILVTLSGIGAILKLRDFLEGVFSRPSS